jgi:hypothetical protein
MGTKEEVQTASKYMKKCSTSLAIKDGQIKTTLRFHLTPVRMAIFKGNNSNKCWRGCSEENTCMLFVEMQISTTIMESSMRFLKKLKIELPYDPVTPFLSIHPKCKSGYSRDTCTPIFMAALFTIAKLWKQPRCPTTDEWIKKLWYMYTMEFYSATRNNDNMCFDGKWMQLEDIMLSEASQAQEDKGCMFSLIRGR